MKKHKGMRPQDVVILLKIIALGDNSWYKKDIAGQLYISNSEVTESLDRSMAGGLIEADKETVRKEPLAEFLVYGLKHVFPAVPGSLVRGMPTAYSAPALSGDYVVDDAHVWPSKDYRTKGIVIPPLYPTVPKACAEDEDLYDLLSLVEALRVKERQEPVIELLVNKMYGV